MSLFVKSNSFGSIVGSVEIVHCCLTDPNDPDGVHPQKDGNGNMLSSPKFAYSDLTLGNFHIAYNSPCVDTGDPNETDDLNETDMDGEIRVFGMSIDIGADEAFSCDDDLSEDDIYNIADFNADGIVNYAEFTILSHSWLAVGNPDPNFADPNYNPVCDMNLDWVVDTDDLAAFIPEWLWVACWRYDIQEMQQQMSMFILSNAEGLTQSGPVLSEVERVEGMASPAPSISMKISPPVETVAVAEETVEPIPDPAAEREQTLSLLEDIESLIDIGGDDTEAWLEIKNLLEQSLVDIEDMINDPNET
jgi:hypothetical protein